MWKQIPVPIARWLPPTIVVPNKLSKDHPKCSGHAMASSSERTASRWRDLTSGKRLAVCQGHSPPPRHQHPDLPRTQSWSSEQAPWTAPETERTGPTPGTLGHASGHCFGMRGSSTDPQTPELWLRAYALWSLELRDLVCYASETAKG